MRRYAEEQIIDNYGQEAFEKITVFLNDEVTYPVNRILVYAEDDTFEVLGGVLTNHGMTVSEAVNLLGVDMDAYAEDEGWDGWDPEALDIVDVE